MMIIINQSPSKHTFVCCLAKSRMFKKLINNCKNIPLNQQSRNPPSMNDPPFRHNKTHSEMHTQLILSILEINFTFFCEM